MPQKIAGTFAGSAGTNTATQTSEVLVLPSGVTSVLFTVTGDVDANNQVSVRRSINNGQTFATAFTTNSPVTNQVVAQAAPEQTHFIVRCNTSQPGKVIHYSLSAES